MPILNTYFLDFETYSDADLTTVGATAYAQHPSARILLAAIAKNDEPVRLWDHRNKSSAESWAALELLEEMLEDDGPIVAHNSAFEETITEYLFGKTFNMMPPNADRWTCTAAMCRMAAIPYDLFNASRFLSLKSVKMEAGTNLIKIFCCPDPKIPKNWDEAAGWETFRTYCIKDVEAERELYDRLKKTFKLPREVFRFDARMNNRGIPVNRDALTKAGTIVDYCMGKLVEEFREITGLNPTQREKVQDWLKIRGYPYDNLKAASMEAVLDDPPENMDAVALRALELRAGSSFASLAKIPVMLAASEHDGRVRGGFMWNGALRTGRWSGKIIQPQNFKRPSIKDTHLAYEMIKRGHPIEDFTDLWDNGLPEIIASCVRHFIELPGKMMLDADFANIEARITPWLCGQEDMLDEFRLHTLKKEELGEKAAFEYDPYVIMAAAIFGVKGKDVTKDQRFVGKTALLGAQYQIGWRKFQMMCAGYGRKLSDDVCKLAIDKYREKRDKIALHWRLYNDAAKEAIRNNGKFAVPVGRVSFRCGKLEQAGFHALRMTLPSGRILNYPLARLQWVDKQFPDGGTSKMEEIQFWGPHKTKAFWGWQSTYGGRIMENLVQAIGGDFMISGLLAAERAGYPAFATIHDQALCIKEEGMTADGFREAMCTLPPWAEGFPLEATAGEVPFYTKD